MGRSAEEFRATYPKAAGCFPKDAGVLLAFSDFSAEHWRHLRSTDAIESPFTGVKDWTRQAKGAGSRKGGLAKVARTRAMAFRLALAGESHSRKASASQPVALVRAGVCFQDGVQRSPHETRASRGQDVDEAPDRIAA